MKHRRFGIIRIDNNNVKIHIYENGNIIYSNETIIDFEYNYYINNIIKEDDINKLCEVLEPAIKYTNNMYIYGYNFFQKISQEELDNINDIIYSKYKIIMAVSNVYEEELLFNNIVMLKHNKIGENYEV